MYARNIKELVIENQTSFFGTLWQTIKAFFQSSDEINLIAVTVVVVVITVAALVWSERADKRRFRRMNPTSRLRQRKR